MTLRRLLIDLQRELGIYIAAVIAGTVRELGVAALGAADVVDGLKGVVRATLALSGFAVFLNRKHDQLLRAGHTGDLLAPQALLLH